MHKDDLMYFPDWIRKHIFFLFLSETKCAEKSGNRNEIVAIKTHVRFINSKGSVLPRKSLWRRRDDKRNAFFLKIVLKVSHAEREGAEWIQIAKRWAMGETCRSKSDKMPEADSLKFPNRNSAYVKRHLEFQSRASGSFEALILDSRTLRDENERKMENAKKNLDQVLTMPHSSSKSHSARSIIFGKTDLKYFKVKL